MNSTDNVWKLLESRKLSLVNIFDSSRYKSEELFKSFSDLLKTTLSDETTLDVGRILASFVNFAFPPKNDASHISNNIPQLRNNNNSGYYFSAFERLKTHFFI